MEKIIVVIHIYQAYGKKLNRNESDIDGEADIDYSGTSVSLSADGTIVAIGAY